ncbi:hypothetical protein EH165_01690 [Nakamurella antarctica]|uniref:Uncharacterized protein n=1 Tax=Nakamurella antarctica TaxID=1902245 RepID=A0A3G8ZIN1_9ACTN|nr:hypothetical protein [Nakamurella antarctica]AZI57070.1 hypothetical protein EH165_01690 [Nakamurella antarctica]
MLITTRKILPFLGVAALTAFLVSLDFLAPGAGWWSSHPMTAGAASALITFIALGLLLEGALKQREAAKLAPILTVAYRSLAQYANDAGRVLLAPLNGPDLFGLGIPGFDRNEVDRIRARLRNNGISPTFNEATGSWKLQNRALLKTTLEKLLVDPAYIQELFRDVATMRRSLQEATAKWAPVMLTSNSTSHDLGDLRQLTNAMELLQEHIRKSRAVGSSTENWVHDPDWLAGVSQQFWSTVACYEQMRDRFGDLAALPSDAIVNRRSG